MVSAVIFDLDHTLFDPRQIPEEVFSPMIRALRSANASAGPDGLPTSRLKEAVVACWLRSFDEVAEEFAIPTAAQAAWIAASRSVHIPGPLKPYPDVRALYSLPTRRFLVTTGYRNLQERKVAALGISGLFEGIYFDALDAPGMRSDKEAVFAQVLHATSLAADAVAVVGDNAASEIAAGKKLGMPTVQILRGDVTASEQARYHIRDLWQLSKVLGVIASPPAR